MTGLAGALVAQVALTSLQLEYMSTIHWIVPALFTTSLVIGFLCVHYSFLLHYWLVQLGSAKKLRKAFSTGKGTPAGSSEDLAEQWVENGEGQRSIGVGTAGQAEGSKLPSYQSVITLAAPSYLLLLAITLYVPTIFLYWCIAGVMDLQGSGGRSLGVGLHVLKPSSAPQADNEFLGLGILPDGNMGGFNCLGGGVRLF